MMKSPKKGPPARIAVAGASHASSTSHSPSSQSRGSPRFDVINSKIPRQQRTHAIYRRNSDPSSSAGPSSHRQQAVKSPSPNRHSTAGQPAKAQRSLGSDNGICKQHSLDSAKQQVQQRFQPKPRRSPNVQSQARASAELMLQANAVLQELDQSLLHAAEAASAEVAAATAEPATHHDSTAVPKRPVPLSLRATSPHSPVVPRVVSSASPRIHVQSQQRECGRLGPSSSTPTDPSPQPQPLQRPSFSMPAQQSTHAPSSVHSLSHSLAQLRRACNAGPTHTDSNRDKQEQRPEQPAQRLTTKSPLLLSNAEPPATQPGLAAEHATPDAASGSVSAAYEPGQKPCHAERSKGQASPERSDTGISHMSQGRSIQGLSGNQPHLPNLTTAPLEKPGSEAASAQADTDSMEIDHRSGILSQKSLQGDALPTLLHPSDHDLKAGYAGTALQPGASDITALAKALSAASGRSPTKAMSSPPGALPHNALPCLPMPWPPHALPWHCPGLLALPCTSSALSAQFHRTAP